MKTFGISALVLASASLVAASPLDARARCATDTCEAPARTVAPATITSDCKSFMETTVVPSPVWRTTTLENPVPVRIGIRVRNSEYTITPSDVPDYMSACSSSVYSSYCSCAGFTPTVTTTSTPTYVSTVKATHASSSASASTSVPTPSSAAHTSSSAHSSPVHTSESRAPAHTSPVQTSAQTSAKHTSA